MFLITLRCIIVLALLGVFSACVSIDLSKTETQKASGIKYTKPNSKFEEIQSENIDKGWRHTGNGNTITYLSDCQNQYDPSLLSIESGVVSGLNNMKMESLKEPMYNSRASRKSRYLGTVDGIPTQISLMTFKKNGCIYVISYIGIANNYYDNIADFENFLKGFKAP